MNPHIIIQARTGSKRLPGKMVMPFYNEKSLLQVIIERLLEKFSKNKIIVATSIEKDDDQIEEIAKKKCGVEVFRGDENDVLKRFIDCAKSYNVNHIIRVCADNPFIIPEYIEELEKNFKEDDDYVSYCFPDKTPSIRSHIGLFSELTTLRTLERVSLLTSENLYREHVTSYIYSNTHIFNVRFLEVPKKLSFRRDIRLTIDTKEDFDVLRYLYGKYNSYRYVELIDVLLKEIDDNPTIKQIMYQQIRKYEK